ncbi:uncharacterized protein GGS25DRAFT_523960 [Hypoxylon fragiforme]|uniref:uncharacterized protein n=1 Tax=Hypoxylon fragiforme TaxID=63214 RepID=UPI0020C679AC|nr:uncharacterized protein GGS25DRAFT_523960 [Hypoxylon fragiforme]KAI2606294.1 hypothetical protein GGS25DRAFT_523960 [Hypoxylon fragiforme]
MPAVNLPQQQTHGDVFLYPPGSQLRLLSRATLTYVGFVVLGVLFLAFKRRYNSTSRAHIKQVDFTTSTLPSLSYSEKSRRVNLQSEAMSVNQPSGVSQTKMAGKLSDGGKQHTQDGPKEEGTEEGLQEGVVSSTSIDTGTPLTFMSGLLPPPLTALPVSTEVNNFQDRRLSIAASTMGDLDTSFFHQPNPDYTLSPSSDSTSTAFTHSQESPSIPRRRSYAKMLPLSPVHTNSESDGLSFSPSSFPSSSPILPLAPHESLESREINVQGEIISVMDDSGAEWKRHTRVYGGGVCLACLASRGQGGFYGDNVPPEHRR